MGFSEQLSVVTPVSRPDLLPHIAPTVPADAEWVLVTDGPLPLPDGLRPHVLVEGPATGRWGDVQRQLGLEAASRPYVTFLDDDNLLLPAVADLVIPALEASGREGALFGVLLLTAAGFFVWPPPVRVERSQVDTAMFLGRTASAREVGWPDLRSGAWPGLEEARCGDYVFVREFEERHRLLRLPLIAGFHDGVRSVQRVEPDLHAALTRGEDVGDDLLALVHECMGQADAPPWWKGRRLSAASGSGPAFVEDPLSARLIELADGTGEGSSVPAQRVHLQTLVRDLAADRPGQPVRVLEIGFNAGLSSVAFLQASAQTHVVSLDLGGHPYVATCAEHLRSVFPDRLHVVLGDSKVTLPRVAAETGPHADLILIDGGHDEVTCRADILNARAAAAPGALVVVDDLMPHKGYGVRVAQVWEELVAAGVLVDTEIWRAPPGAREPLRDRGEPVETCERRWGLARYGEPS